LNTWEDIHKRYDEIWIKYTLDKQKHAFATLCDLSGKKEITVTDWNALVDKAVKIQKFVNDQVYTSRKKDYDNPYKHTTFRNTEEMKAALGSVDENSFIIQVRQETEDFEKLAKEVVNRRRTK
jgi:hypothetical protein